MHRRRRKSECGLFLSSLVCVVSVCVVSVCVVSVCGGCLLRVYVLVVTGVSVCVCINVN